MTSAANDQDGHGPPIADRLALSVEEDGALLGISRDLAYDLVACGRLPSVRLGRRVVVPRFALEQALRDMVGTADGDDPKSSRQP